MTSLNPDQERAVTFGDGALLVIAGAGSGKTRVLTHRAAHLLRDGSVDPREILAFTFTNRAAREMRERLLALVGETARDLWVGTFHATCLRILRHRAENVGLPAGFTVFDREDQLALVGRLLKARDINLRELSPAFVLSRISGAKNELMDPEEYATSAVTGREQIAAEIYRAYQDELATQAALDFDDLIGTAVRLLESDAETRGLYARRFRHVLVDEYQDTNHAQFRLVAALASGHGNVLAVGDEDQSIYAWRGADLSNVLEFEKRFPNASVVRLEQNYRSTSIILDAASAVIANNRRRRGKRLWTDKEGGREIRLLLCGDEQAEAERIAGELQRHRARGRSPREFAVLYRTNAQSRALELTLRQLGVPYELVGGISFYDRREIKDLLAYLRLAVNPRDRVSFLRIANVPRRGIGDRSLGKLGERLQLSVETPGEELRRLVESGEISGPGGRGAQTLLRILGELERRREEPPDSLLEWILDRVEYRDYLEEHFSQDASDRLENIEELLSAARQYAALGEQRTSEDFLSEAALMSDVDRWTPSEERVVLMTAHNAKGLEFDTVAITGMEEGIFPHSSALGDEDELEEERRLFYVALTRAREEAIVSAAAFRRRFDGRGAGELSRFIEEIPPHLLQRENPAGWSGSGRSRGRSDADAWAVAREDDEHAGRVVYHESFGKGTVLSSEGEGSRTKFTVRFESVGTKKVLGRFLIPDD